MSDAAIRRILLTTVFVAVVAVVVWLYRSFDPALQTGFPQCVVYRLTGWLCPGCGSQRALHALLNGNVAAAFAANPAVFVMVPLAGLYALVEWTRWPRLAPLRRVLLSPQFIIGLLAAVLLYTVLRNLAFFGA